MGVRLSAYRAAEALRPLNINLARMLMEPMRVVKEEALAGGAVPWEPLGPAKLEKQ